MKLKIREDLEIELKNWTGATKQKFIGIFREKGMKISEKDIYDILILPYIEPNTDFLNSAEYQYILIELKKLNFGDEFSFEMNCGNKDCDGVFEVDTSLSQITNYEPNAFVNIKDNLDFVKLKNIQSQEIYQNAELKLPDENKVFLQMLLSIIEINTKQSESIESVLEDLENLPLTEYNIIEELFIKNSSKIELGLDIECPECSILKTYHFDAIPGFFEDILPKKK